VVVLKGHRSLVATPAGELYVNPTGNPGMATGGSGDVLTGMIAALLAQGLEGRDAACCGVYLHGLAGDRAARRRGEVALVAGDLVDELPGAIGQLQGAGEDE
jgi:NAD(P)H-hydrate epimerase